MNCYDCHQTGNTSAAVAVCHDCGAGVCADHAVQGQHALTVVTATNWQAPVDPPQRRIRCLTCAAAENAADELSIAKAVPR
jgi:hypothetical protein